MARARGIMEWVGQNCDREQGCVYLVDQAVFEYGVAYLPVQLAEGLHLVGRDCKKQEAGELASPPIDKT
jgi:hypothetical protein